jgi:hypothetical protein
MTTHHYEYIYAQNHPKARSILTQTNFKTSVNSDIVVALEQHPELETRYYITVAYPVQTHETDMKSCY